MAVLTPKQEAILKRSNSNKTANNYSEAVDEDSWISWLDYPSIKIPLSLISPFKSIAFEGSKFGDKVVTFLDFLSANNIGTQLVNGDKIPSGQSNCTLTATQWVDPSTPIGKASTIINDGSQYGYVEIPRDHALPGDLIIATNPNNNAHHTMLLSDFADKDYEHEFLGKRYLIPKDHELVTYSNGSTHSSGYRKNIGLLEYLDNSDGKTDVKYYRHLDPHEEQILLPTLVVTPEGSYVPEGQNIISISRNKKIPTKTDYSKIINYLLNASSPINYVYNILK